jgi:hypothetical protein
MWIARLPQFVVKNSERGKGARRFSNSFGIPAVGVEIERSYIDKRCPRIYDDQ